MRKFQFTNGEIYHVYNRGVDKRDIFLNNKDYFRMVHNLFEFNDKSPAINHPYYRFCGAEFSESRSQKIQSLGVKKRESEPRKLLVEILAWCLMPNHFHLLVRQLQDGGVSYFMGKLGIGYAMYFNEKNKRSGALFQGRFKAIHIEDERHFMYLPFYIHANALDLIEPDWRKGEIKDIKKANDFLNNFRWSSHLDYIGTKNFPSLTQRDFLLDVFKQEGGYKNSFQNWLKDMDLEEIQDSIIKS